MISYDNLAPLSYAEFVKIENKIYKLNHINKRIQAKKIEKNVVLKRPIETFHDKSYNLPENIFILDKQSKYPVVGRKIRSPLSFSNKINAINCSRVTASMLLGYLNSYEKKGNDITITYYPFTQCEKLGFFESIKHNRQIDIYYPFNHTIFETNMEESTPPSGWDLNPEKVVYLGYGEKHIRQYTKNLFKDFFKKNVNLYDPACSTGQFLWEIKKKYPNVHTIGHDLSQSMINYAKDYLDESMVIDAKDSPINVETIDMLFLRFLNVEVVTKEEAHQLFDSLIKKVKPKGLIVCFGHTPVLIQKEYFLEKKLKVLQSNGFDKRTNSIFQYYVLEREESL